MLLIGPEDEDHKELQNRAKEIRFRPEDMIAVPNMVATFRLPNKLYPEAASGLSDFFYEQQRGRIYKLARRERLLIARKAIYGPQIVCLKGGGRLSVKENRLLFSIVIPKPSEYQMTDEEVGAVPRVRVKITSPVSVAFPALSSPVLEIGDVIILEGGEELLVGAESSDLKDQSICLISALHITFSGVVEEGGWKEGTGEEVGGNQPVV